MKKVFLFILLLLTIYLPGYSQSCIPERKIKIGTIEATLGEILDEIAQKGEFHFSYGQDIQRNKQVSLSSSDQTVQQYINELFGSEIYCVEFENKLILMRRPDSPATYLLIGRISDMDTKEPVPGVTIYIPGATPPMGTVSDDEGYFKIKVPISQTVVKLSCIGYESDSLITGRTSLVNIELNPQNHELSEVRIVYYMPVKEENQNAAISVIPPEKLTNIQTGSIEESIQGTAAGVHVIHNSGMPGASIQVKVRGINSLINSDPVYFIDGNYLQESSLYALSPHDIERIEIIKDVSGTAQFGASAGNGVVLFHSKTGKAGKPVVKFNYSFGIQQVWKKPDLMSSEEYLYWFNVFKPDNPTFQEYNIDSLVNENWIEALFHPGKIQDYHFSVSGGNKHSTFYISSGYLNQESIISNMEMSRYSFKVRTDHAIGGRIKLGQDIALTYLEMKGLEEGVFMNDFNNPILGAMQMLPLINESDTTSRFWHLPRRQNAFSYDNMKLNNNSRNNYSLLSNLLCRIDLFKGLSYQTGVGVELYFQDNISYRSSQFVYPGEYTVGCSYNIRDLSFNWQQNLEYTKTIARNHSFTANAAFEYGRIDHEWVPIEATHFDSLWNQLGDVETGWEAPSGTDFFHHSLTGSLNYEYRDKLQLNVNLRREKIGYYDHLMVFQHLSDVYPSFSMGWIFTREEFFPCSWISYGKLRVGWGRAGISPRLNYSFFANMIQETEYLYALSEDITKLRSPYSRRTNERLYWEPIQGSNAGLDLGFMENKLFISIDYFTNYTQKHNTWPINKPKKIIQDLQELHTLGMDYSKSASIQNTGLECELSYRYSWSDLQWEINLNAAHLRSKILDIDKDDIIDSEGVIAVHLPGERAGSFYGYKIERLFTAEDCDQEGKVINDPAQPNARAGDYKFVDSNKNGLIDPEDRIILGNPYPDFTFGVYQSVQLRNFDLSFFIQGTRGNEIFNATKYWTYNPYGFSNWTSDVANSYRFPGENDEGNTNTNLHRMDEQDRNGNFRVSDFYIEDGSYLRLKNIQLGYSILIKISKQIQIQKLRIWLGAQNLFTWTNYSGLDPEVGGWGIDCGIYPQPRVYMAGVNLEL
jgi:TonB-dependent starch-binding outer membrane protein SusC